MDDSFVTPWTVDHQAPLSMGFLKQEYWRGLPFLSPGHLPDPGIEPASPALASKFFTTEPWGSPYPTIPQLKKKKKEKLPWASLIAQLVKNPPAMQEMLVPFLSQEDLLKKR